MKRIQKTKRRQRTPKGSSGWKCWFVAVSANLVAQKSVLPPYLKFVCSLGLSRSQYVCPFSHLRAIQGLVGYPPMRSLRRNATEFASMCD
jgi:hypothetical protein